MQATYVTSALKPEQLPVSKRAEIAFIGRSNTGKSSLLNSLTGVKSLARTSRTPGRTQMVNFFTYGEHFHLVDLPGYGFSKTPMAVAKNWDQLIGGYLKRPNISAFLFLMDCRRDIDDADKQLLRQIGRQLPPLVVLTKADKISRQQLTKKIKETRSLLETLKLPFQDVLATSGPKKTGIQELKDVLFTRD